MPTTKSICLLAASFVLGGSLAWTAEPARAAGTPPATTGPRKELIAPLFNYERDQTKLKWSFSPLAAKYEDKDTDSEEFDALYPFLTYDRFGDEWRFQILQLFSFSGGNNQDDNKERKFTLFPFYFQKRSLDPKLEYTALLPFYGTIKNRLMRDEIHFVMLPFYMQTKKKDVVTDNYLLPFFHLRTGNGLKGWQFWPIVGNEHKDITTKTNGFGDVEIVGGHDKFFGPWPFFIKQRLATGTTNAQTNLLILPLYSSQSSLARDTTSYGWPLGVTLINEREKKYREVGAPWPLIAFARGEGKTMNRVWPLFGQAHNQTRRNDFYLWPLVKYSTVNIEPLESERFRILYFLYSDLTEKNTETGRVLRRTDLWPLFTARHDPDGSESLHVLALAEPMLPNNKSVQRNWSPVWALWRQEKDGKTGDTMQSFFWNFYRQRTTGDTRNSSLFFGLFHYESGPGGSRWRMFQPPEPLVAPAPK